MWRDKMNNIPILISFSGGRTSAFMAKFISLHESYSKRDKHYVFANTGKEREETLVFVQRCSEKFGINVIWVEAVVSPEKGSGTRHKIVNFKTASRNGEPFEDVIKKYGLPNKQTPHCTRELKLNPIKSYMRSIGVSYYETAIGIRKDEQHRATPKKGIIYPLVDLNVTEEIVRSFWDRQNFDLELKDYEGNCDLCFKKSIRKKLTLIKDNPSMADWWIDMEKKYCYSGSAPYGGPYKFDQRSNITVKELLNKSRQPFEKARDKHEVRKLGELPFDPVMDVEFSCLCKSS